MFVINDLKTADFMEGMTITRKENSLIEIAHKKIIVPEKKSRHFSAKRPAFLF